MNSNACSFHQLLALADRKELYSLLLSRRKRFREHCFPWFKLEILIWKYLGEEEKFRVVGYVFTGAPLLPSSLHLGEKGQKVHFLYGKRKLWDGNGKRYSIIQMFANIHEADIM